MNPRVGRLQISVAKAAHKQLALLCYSFGDVHLGSDAGNAQIHSIGFDGRAAVTAQS